MAAGAVSVEDRLAITELFARYAWALDCGDAEGYAALFVPDGMVQTADGLRFHGTAEIRAMVADLVALPGFRGTQHQTSHLRIAGGGDQVTTANYFVSIRMDPSDGHCHIKTMGSHSSVCVKIGGTWLLKERVIRSWRGDGLPWQGGEVSA
jgi:uncharacterized protein (TIGR02246 family)